MLFRSDRDVVCILDNAKIKEGKYLYGFDYIVKNPDIIRDEFDKKAVVLIFTGTYVDEIKKQISSINQNIKTITMSEFRNEL